MELFDNKTAGSGAPIVLLHGFPTPPASMDILFESLQEDFSVYLIDTALLGVSPVEALETLRQTLLAIDVEEPILIGHSLGAYRAFQLAIDGQINPKRIISIGGMHRLPAEQIDGFSALADLYEKGELDLVDTALPLWFCETYLDAADPRPMVENWLAPYSRERIANCLRHDGCVEDLSEGLRELKIPVDLIYSPDDTTIDPLFSQEIEGLMENATIHEIEGAGHFPFIEKPDLFQNILEKILLTGTDRS